MAFSSQAFCGDDDCRVFTWDPTQTVDDFFNGMVVVDLPDLGDPGSPAGGSSS